MTLLKQIHCGTTSARKISRGFQQQQKLLSFHFGNKPTKRVFCLVSPQAIFETEQEIAQRRGIR
jgi:hypothetical protein